LSIHYNQRNVLRDGHNKFLSQFTQVHEVECDIYTDDK
jgi:hypothetical protein